LGPIQAVAISVTGNFLSAVIGYFLGKTLVLADNWENFNNSLPEWARKYDITSPIFIILGRMLPIGRIPLSYLCGAYRIPFFRYCWSSLVAYFLMASIIGFTSFGLGHLF
jgi:membrane protein DedA with SNARE-associated domain